MGVNVSTGNHGHSPAGSCRRKCRPCPNRCWAARKVRSRCRWEYGNGCTPRRRPSGRPTRCRHTAGFPPSRPGNDERAAVVPVVGHDLGHVRNAVQPERIARAYPGHVRLQHAHSGVPHLLHDIPLEQSADFRLGMQVGLGPQPDFHAVLPGVVRQTLQIRNIASRVSVWPYPAP